MEQLMLQGLHDDQPAREQLTKNLLLSDPFALRLVGMTEPELNSIYLDEAVVVFGRKIAVYRHSQDQYVCNFKTSILTLRVNLAARVIGTIDSNAQ